MKFLLCLAAFTAALNINVFAKDLIKIGVLGNSTNAVSVGAYNTITLLASEAEQSGKNYEIQPVFFDDSNIEISDRIKAESNLFAVIGSFGERDRDIAENITDIPLISIGSEYSSFTGKKNTFRIIASEPEIAAITARIDIVLFDRKKCAVVYEEGNIEDLKMAQAYADAAKRNGADAAFFKSFSAGIDDFTPLINRMRETRVKVVYFAGNPKDAALFCSQNVAMQTGAVMTGPSYIFDREFIKTTKEASDGCETVMKTKSSLYNYKKIKQFISAYEKKFGMKASIYTPYTHDAASIILLAVESGKMEPAEINAFLKDISYTGATGKVAFDTRGERVSPEFYFNVLRRKELFYMPFDSEKNTLYKRAK